MVVTSFGWSVDGYFLWVELHMNLVLGECSCQSWEYSTTLQCSSIYSLGSLLFLFMQGWWTTSTQVMVKQFHIVQCMDRVHDQIWSIKIPIWGYLSENTNVYS